MGDRSTAPAREHIPAAVRREVWKRDGGRCAWTRADGRRCTSTWKLELDHIDAVARGGAATVDNLRLACRAHNVFHAERLFGLECMAHFTRLRPD
jgi:5-methylcytosine-specific restriction endonuclease McrA